MTVTWPLSSPTHTSECLIDSISLLDWTIAKPFHGDHIIIRGGQDCAPLQDGPVRTLDRLCPASQEQESVHTHKHTLTEKNKSFPIVATF